MSTRIAIAGLGAAARTIHLPAFATLDVELLAGRTFSRDVGTDIWELDESNTQAFFDFRMTSVPEVNAVIDRTAALQLGWSDPRAAVGQLFYSPMQEDQPVQPIRVVGVVEALPMRVVTWGRPRQESRISSIRR